MNKRKVYPRYMLIIPLIVFGVFFLLPSTVGYGYAFTDWNPYVSKISFVGLNNFKEVFANKTLVTAAINTFSFALIKTVFVTVLGIGLALVLNTHIKSKNILRTVYFLPSVFSALIVGLIFAGLFDARNGVINTTLISMGLDKWVQPWLGERIPAMVTINLAEIWRSTGYGTIITLAALQSLPQDCLESATMDGATGWQKFRHIMLPLMMPALNVNILFSLIYGLKMFDLVMILTSGGPGHDTETFGTLIMSEMSRDRYAQSVAINLVFSILLVIVAMLYQKFEKKTEDVL